MIDSQDEVKALVADRNMGDPLKLLSGFEQLDCAQLTAELVSRRRDLDLFASQIRLVEERRSLLTAEIATAEAARGRRTNELDAAADRASTDERALHECLVHGTGMVNGECTIQEAFRLQSRIALRQAKQALAAAARSLQVLQDKDSEVGLELLSLKADRVAIEDESTKIISIMEKKGCPIPAA